MATSRAFRITLSYTQGGFTLRAAARVEKVVPPSASREAGYTREPQAGSWIAVEDAARRPLYRRAVENPLGPREVFAGEERDFRRVRVPPADVVVLLVPDLPGGDRVVLYASDPAGAPARPVFTVSVRDVVAQAERPGGGHGRE